MLAEESVMLVMRGQAALAIAPVELQLIHPRHRLVLDSLRRQQALLLATHQAAAAAIQAPSSPLCQGVRHAPQLLQLLMVHLR
jgi:hypothetical protein